MRIVFMGTPDFAAAILRQTAAWEGGKIVAVYAQPDRPAGRGNKLREPATKILAKELNLPVYQPANFKSDEDVAAMAALQPDVLVVAAYGLLLPQRVLDIPKLGPFNVHASLLPKYRGAAPIQRAVMNGNKFTGVTIMRMEVGLDTGPILLQQAVSINPEDTSGSMFEVLAEHGAKLMRGALGMLAENRAAFIAQNDEVASYAPKIKLAEEYVDWSRSAEEVHNHVRGLFPSPGARTVLHMPGQEPLPLRLEPGIPPQEERAEPVPGAIARELLNPNGPAAGRTPEPEQADSGHEPGTILEFRNGSLVVACGRGTYQVTRLRPAGKASMNAADFRNGRLRELDPPYGVLRPA